jgi:hypothetical protein
MEFEMSEPDSTQGAPGTLPESPGLIPSSHPGHADCEPPPIASPPVTRKLDLASGQSPREGFEGVDIWDGAQHVVDLQSYPWPFEDASVAELNCSHYIEHIPMVMVDLGRTCTTCGDLGVNVNVCGVCHGYGVIPTGKHKDALFAFFDECYRILVPDGWLFITVPAHRNDRAFQDPTHRRFITQVTFAYMNEQWRRDNRLDHYNVDCNFIGECNPVVDTALTLRHPDVANQRIIHQWNTVIDWTARLQKKPRLPPR